VTWQPGKAYTYNFTLTPNLQVDFDTEITVNDWGAPTVLAYFCGDGTAGTEPGSTTTFESFNPCANAAVGTVWYLDDTRESENLQNYKVKKMQDGRIWMVQDMKFGDKCGTEFAGSSADQTGKVSSTGTYYGDCTNAKNEQTPDNRGYLYDWAAAMNQAGAYYGGSYQGCSGTATGGNACQGICPAGWHIPTGAAAGEFYDLHTNYGRGCGTENDNCWNAQSDWEGVYGGYCNNTGTLTNGVGRYWSSTYYSNNTAYLLAFSSDNTNLSSGTNQKNYGFPVRCVRNNG
jgi:uncharacterized protein (TIGR02145 family)